VADDCSDGKSSQTTTELHRHFHVTNEWTRYDAAGYDSTSSEGHDSAAAAEGGYL